MDRVNEATIIGSTWAEHNLATNSVQYGKHSYTDIRHMVHPSYMRAQLRIISILKLRFLLCRMTFRQGMGLLCCVHDNLLGYDTLLANNQVLGNGKPSQLFVFLAGAHGLLAPA